MSISFKFKKVLKQRQELISKYPNLIEQCQNCSAGYVDVSWLIPEGVITEEIDCRPYFRDAVTAARVLFPFGRPKYVWLPTGNYNTDDDAQ